MNLRYSHSCNPQWQRGLCCAANAGKNLFKEINDLIEARKVNVGGKEINIEFYLGGDYEVCYYT